MLPKKYISYNINEPDADKQEILVAMFQDFGFDGFEQTDTQLIANGYEESLNESEIENYLQNNYIIFSKSILKEENWNKMWESEFHPIIIDHFCAVRASFHEPVVSVEYEIIITPKMSFGTGHHATTWMMLKAMEKMDFAEKSVIDFGTGTGLLAILAEKMGAKTIEAIDYDDWCIENGKENIEANSCTKINIVKADTIEIATPSDVILANINKNILKDNFEAFKKLLNVNGQLLISGILLRDEKEIVIFANQCGLKLVDKKDRNGWLCISFKHAA